MSAMNIDKSLEDIIKTNPRRGRRGRGGRGGALRSAGGISKRGAGARSVPAVKVAKAAVNIAGDENSKIIVSNLPFDVTEAQVKVCRVDWFMARVS